MCGKSHHENLEYFKSAKIKPLDYMSIMRSLMTFELSIFYHALVVKFRADFAPHTAPIFAETESYMTWLLTS